MYYMYLLYYEIATHYYTGLLVFLGISEEGAVFESSELRDSAWLRNV